MSWILIQDRSAMIVKNRINKSALGVYLQYTGWPVFELSPVFIVAACQLKGIKLWKKKKDETKVNLMLFVYCSRLSRLGRSQPSTVTVRWGVPAEEMITTIRTTVTQAHRTIPTNHCSDRDPLTTTTMDSMVISILLPHVTCIFWMKIPGTFC